MLSQRNHVLYSINLSRFPKQRSFCAVLIWERIELPQVGIEFKSLCTARLAG